MTRKIIFVLSLLLTVSGLTVLAAADDEKVVIQYDCIPNYANWGGVTALYKKVSGVTVPPDPKGSSLALAILRVGFEQFLARIGDFRVPDGFEPVYETGNTRHMSTLPLLFAAGGAKG